MALDVIKIQTGLIKGVPCGNPAYTVLKGIPFAKPPVGEYRWKAPAPPEPWDGVKTCDTFAPISVQKFLPEGEFYQKEFFPVEMPMSEDCLYLNVWTPSITGKEKLPVMMWVHGGAFIRGYGHEMEFDGEAFCKRDVILVTVPYRLGALGFFAHPELSAKDPHNVSGNYAVLDLIQALEWIKSNIEAFGGDPSNVTIFGQSAGGILVQALCTSPLSKGLFHKAIVHSATGINSMRGKYTLADAEICGKDATDKLNITLEELTAMPAEELNDLLNTVIDPNALRMMPNTDGYVLPDAPGDAVAFGKHHDIPYMTGSVQQDGKLFSGFPNAKNITEFETYLEQRYGIYADKYKKLFNVQDDIDVNSALDALIYATAKLAPYSWANAHLKLGRKPAYVYYFDRDIPGYDHPGAFHSSELWYVFGTLNRCWRPMEAIDYKLSLIMTDYWTNFAKSGNPNGANLPSWPELTNENPVIMEINEHKVKAVPIKDKILIGMEELLLEQVYSDKINQG